MLTLIFPVSCILTIILYLKRRELERKGGKTFTYHFIQQSLDFLIPFCVITFIFLALSLYVSGATDSATVHKLIWLENALQYLKDKASFLKLGAIGSFVILFALFIINLLGIPSIYTERFFPVFKKYNKVIKKIYVALVLLCSFTFFGNQLGQPIANLRFRINERSNEARKGYGDLQQEVRSAISKEVVGRLYDETYKAFPQSYQDSLHKQEELARYLSILRANYKDGSYRRYDAEDIRFVTALLNEEPPEGPQGGGGSKGGPNDPSPPHSPTEPTNGSGSSGPSKSRMPDSDGVIGDFFDGIPEQVTSSPQQIPSELDPQEVKAASEKVRTFGGEYQTNAIKFFKSEAGKDLLVQPPKIITSSIKKYIFEELTRRYPILDPIISVFTGAFDKEMETKVQEAAARATDMLLKNPEQTNSIINNEVAAIVKAKVSRIPRVIVEKAQELGNTAREKLQKVIGLNGNLTEKQEIAQQPKSPPVFGQPRVLDEASSYIELLVCNVHENRIKAADWLLSHGHELSKEQVNTIKYLLDNNEKRYIILGNNSRFIQNVTQYEVAPIKYYAALALRGMNSPYVSLETKAQARTIASDSLREIGASRTYASQEIFNRGVT